jgi:hypothetical protein
MKVAGTLTAKVVLFQGFQSPRGEKVMKVTTVVTSTYIETTVSIPSRGEGNESFS